MIRIKTVMARAVLTARRTDSLKDLVATLERHKVGSAVVINRKKQVVGIVTERDLIRGLNEWGASLLKKKTGDLMTPRPVVLDSGENVMTAADVMLAHRIKRIPVTADGRLCGIISFRDIANTLRKANDLLEKKSRRLKVQAVTDPLTGLYNKAYLAEKLTYHTRLAKKAGKSMAVLMIDIDFFKKVNDTYGHPCGDRVLKDLAALLQRVSRTVNVVGRYGGEEFLIIAPIADYKSARFLGERIRAEAERMVCRCGKKTFCITVSVGVALWYGAIRSGKKLVDQADAALYRAKENGRNQVRMAGRTARNRPAGNRA